MICEKCSKNVGTSKDDKASGNKITNFTEEIKTCPRCKAIFCLSCAEKMGKCNNCGTVIKC